MQVGVPQAPLGGARNPTVLLGDITVQIRRAPDDTIVGTSMAVSTEGRIVICTHVVRGASVDARDVNGAEGGVYFPRARGGEEKKRCAKVTACFPHHDDDMVLLQLTDGAAPLGRDAKSC